MSASDTEALMFILVMSCAMVKQHRRAHRGDHGLAQVHLARDDDAVHRGGDFAVTEIRPGAFQHRLLDDDRGFRLRQFGGGLVEIQLRGRLEGTRIFFRSRFWRLRVTSALALARSPSAWRRAAS